MGHKPSLHNYHCTLIKQMAKEERNFFVSELFRVFFRSDQFFLLNTQFCLSYTQFCLSYTQFCLSYNQLCLFIHLILSKKNTILPITQHSISYFIHKILFLKVLKSIQITFNHFIKNNLSGKGLTEVVVLFMSYSKTWSLIPD